MIDSSEFGARMAPEVREVNPPITWSGWWDYPIRVTVEVPGLGTVQKIHQDDSPSSDSYSYYEVRSMVFAVIAYGEPSRWFQVSKESSSFDTWGAYSEEAWDYPTISEVTPEEMTVTRWRPV